MAEGSYTTRRANPRFSFFADAEVTVRDGTCVRAQLSELSSRGCYIDTLERSTQQSTRGCANSPGVLVEIWERTPSLKSEAKSHRINGPSCNRTCL